MRRRSSRGFAAVFVPCLVALASSPASGEVRRLLTVCAGKICPHYEAVVTPPRDWSKDDAASQAQGAQVYVPRGKTFGSADAVIYVRAARKDPEQSLADFIRVSQERWRAAVPDTRIALHGSVARHNGKPAFESYRYENPGRKQQAFEIVSFGEDSDKDGEKYVVMVVLTALRKQGLAAAEPTYRALLKAH